MTRTIALSALLLAALLPAGARATEDASERLVPAMPRPAAEATSPDHLRRLVALGRERSDPRLMDRAATLLDKALAEAPQDAGLLTLRAVIRQWNHDFPGAETDLAAVLALRPGDPQALISRAFLRASTGNLTGAAEDCRAVPVPAGPVARAACHARVLGLTGKATEAHKLLSWALLSSGAVDAGTRVWALTVLSDLSLRLGETARAEKEAADAVALAPASEGPGLRLAAILLENGKAGAALAALTGHASDEALLLRAKALAAAGQDATPAAQELGQRIAAARRDGAYRHDRIEGEWLVRFGGDPARGLDLLAANWARVKEPEDLRALLAAAALAGRPEAARDALAWRVAQGTEDRVADRLAAALTGENLK